MIRYNHSKGTFYLIKKHNAICDGETVIEYDNNIDVENTILEHKDFNNKIIKFLNEHPLLTFNV